MPACLLAALLLAQPAEAPLWTPPAIDMPVPNARDSYLAAVALVVKDEALAQAAYVDDWQPRPGDDPFLDDPRLAARAAYVEANAAALAKLREALPLEFREPLVFGFDTSFAHLAGLRELARILQMEAQVRGAEWEWEAAFDSCLDSLEMGHDIRRGGVLINDLVGIAIGAIARNTAWDIVPRMEGEDGRAALRRLERLCAESIEFWQVLDWEYLFTRGTLARMLEDQTAIEAFAGAGLELDAGEQEQLEQYLRDHTPRQVFDEIDAYLTTEVDRARAPWGAAGDEPTPPPLLEPLIPATAAARLRHLTDQGSDRGLLLTLALQLWQQQHGAWPETLVALVPDYLAALPPDPFTAGEPFRYAPTDDGYTLYSLGPDGDDDGGRPVKHLEEAGRMRFSLREGDDGDAVVGVNLR